MPRAASAQGPPATAPLVELAHGFIVSRALWVAAERRVADELADGPAPVADVAARVGLRPDVLLRLMRLLATAGVFAETGEPGTFANTPLSELLTSDHELAGRDAVVNLVGDFVWKTYGALPEAAASGEMPFRAAHGESLWSFYERDPEEHARFNRMMSIMHAGEPAAVAAACDLAGARTVVDVGGGIGTLLGTLLAANPGVSGVLGDRPDVLEQATAELERLGVADRCRLEAIDFHEELPAGGDVYLLSHIVHDWDEETARALLARCAAALGPDGRLLIVEMVIPAGNDPHPGKVLDIVMLTMHGGRERTAAEYEELLEASGLRLVQIVPTGSAVSIVEARVRA